MKIFAFILASITNQPRQKVVLGIDFEWSKSWVYNLFRIFELIFWRREGIRAEGSLLGNGIQVSYTWEHLFVVWEEALRTSLKAMKPKFKIVYLPQLQLAGIAQGGVSPFRFAIAYDNSKAEVAAGNNTNTVSGSYTVTGSNTILLGFFLEHLTTSAYLSSTYNSATMAFVTNVQIPSDRWSDASILPGAATGSNTMTLNLSNSTSDDLEIYAASYSGAAQSSQPDNSNTHTTSSGVSPNASSITINTANSWWVAFIGTRGQPATFTTGTQRFSVGIFGGALADSGIAVGTGSASISCTITSPSTSAMLMVSIKPIGSAPTVIPLRTLLGVGI